MAVTSTASKTTAEKNSRVQNQAMRMMTGAMKTTPIRELETTSGLPTLENRQNSRVLTRAVTFKRLHSHPMAARMSQPTKKRLKGSSFIHQSRIPEKRDPELLDHEPKAIPQNISISSWKKAKFPVIKDNIPEIEITDPRVHPVQLPSEQGDPCLHGWICHRSNQRLRWRSVHQVQRRGIRPLTSNWKVPNKRVPWC